MNTTKAEAQRKFRALQEQAAKASEKGNNTTAREAQQAADYIATGLRHGEYR